MVVKSGYIQWGRCMAVLSHKFLFFYESSGNESELSSPVLGQSGHDYIWTISSQINTRSFGRILQGFGMNCLFSWSYDRLAAVYCRYDRTINHSLPSPPGCYMKAVCHLSAVSTLPSVMIWQTCNSLLHTRLLSNKSSVVTCLVRCYILDAGM